MNDLHDDTQSYQSSPSFPPTQNEENAPSVSFPDGPSIAFVGTGMEMFKIYAVNILLTIITFGVYYVWGKTKLRRYVWSKSLLFHEPLEYTGTGWEIFRSLLIVGTLFFAINLGVAFASSGDIAIALIFNAIWLGVMMLLAPYALYCALRFRFSRTCWRGIRGRMGGSAFLFASKGVLLGLLLFFSLGLAYPFVYQRLAHYAVREARFGSASFRLDSKAGALAKYFLPCWLATIVLLLPGVLIENEFLILAGVLIVSALWLIFPAIQLNWLLGGIRMVGEHEELTLYSSIPLVGFLLLNITNTLAVVLSLGLAWPWARARRLRYIASFLSISGNLDWASISQSPEAPVTFGEGIFSMLDLDLGF